MMGQDWLKTFDLVRVVVRDDMGVGLGGLGDVGQGPKIDVVRPEGGIDFSRIRPRQWHREKGSIICAGRGALALKAKAFILLYQSSR